MNFKTIMLSVTFFSYSQDYEFKKRFNEALSQNKIVEALNIICEVNKKSKKDRALIDFFSNLFEKKWNISVFELSKLSISDKSQLVEKINILEKKVEEIKTNLESVEEYL